MISAKVTIGCDYGLNVSVVIWQQGCFGNLWSTYGQKGGKMCLAYWIGKGERLKWDGFHSCTMISSTNSMFLEKPRCLAGETVEQLGDSYSPLSQFSHAIRIRGQKARGCADSGKTTMSVSIRRRCDQTEGRSVALADTASFKKWIFSLNEYSGFWKK